MKKGCFFITFVVTALLSLSTVYGIYLEEDLNDDNVVDTDDLVLLISAFGKEDSEERLDLNNDERVDLFDMVPVAKNLGKERVINPRVGINVLPRWQERFDIDKTEQYTDILAESGVKYVRVFVRWDQLQPEENVDPRQWNWAEVDRMLKNLHDNKLELVVVLTAPPVWASDAPNSDQKNATNYLPTNYTLWNKYVAWVVARYGGQGNKYVKYWEVENEPDLPRIKYDVSEYKTHLIRTYNTIKTWDPDAKVLHAGLFFSDTEEWYEEFLSYDNITSYFDVVSFHIYAEPDSAVNFLNDFNKVLEENSVDKPVWVTEVNWGWWNYITEKRIEQCPDVEDEKYLVFNEYFTNLNNAGADKIFWFTDYCHIFGPGLMNVPGGYTFTTATEEIEIRERSLDVFKEHVEQFMEEE